MCSPAKPWDRSGSHSPQLLSREPNQLGGAHRRRGGRAPSPVEHPRTLIKNQIKANFPQTGTRVDDISLFRAELRRRPAGPAGSVSLDVTKRSAEDVGDKVSLSGKRFETGFKGKRGALLLGFGSQRKTSFQLKHLTHQTQRTGNSRLFG